MSYTNQKITDAVKRAYENLAPHVDSRANFRTSGGDFGADRSSMDLGFLWNLFYEKPEDFRNTANFAIYFYGDWNLRISVPNGRTITLDEIEPLMRLELEKKGVLRE